MVIILYFYGIYIGATTSHDGNSPYLFFMEKRTKKVACRF